MRTRTYSVPQLYAGDQKITVSLALPSMTGSMVTPGSWVAYSITFDMPGEADPIVLRGTDLHAPAGRDVKPIDMYRSLCGFLGYFGEHSRPDGYCAHSEDDADCPVAVYPEAVRDALYAEADRLSMAADLSESLAA